jgi:hypothetical protein
MEKCITICKEYIKCLKYHEIDISKDVCKKYIELYNICCVKKNKKKI